MGLRRVALLLAIGAVLGGIVRAQQPSGAAPIERSAPAADPALDTAAEYVGRALFLRCFCAENNLSFDVQGKPVGNVKAEDWTLAAVNVTKVERKAAGSIEMDGVRVAIRYAADRHEFERHPQNDDKMRITLADTGDPKQMQQALDTVFAVGIDARLQRAMPDYWRHYFDPKMPWAADDLSGQTIYSNGPGFTPATATHKAEPSYTAFAQRDHVKGMVQVRLVVDAQGMPRRIAIAQPLGYGLDEKTVEAVEKFRFAPATSAGKPVASTVLVDQEFVVVPMPQ
jgi:TonB family protein